jgi:hypothetical protein
MRSKTVRDLLEHVVSLGVTERVICRFRSINIDKAQHKTNAFSLGAPDISLQFAEANGLAERARQLVSEAYDATGLLQATTQRT